MTETTEKRAPGRPPLFPGVETTKLSPRVVPADIPDLLEAIAGKKGEPVSATLDRIIRAAHRQAFRERSTKGSGE